MITNTQLTLTPTARLARNQLQAYALTQIQQDRGAWQPPAILSFSAWIGALRNNYFLDTDDPRVTIDDNQANVLWQSLVAEGVFIGEPEVAGLAQSAWRLVHEYRLPPPESWPPAILSEDSSQFKQWCAAYRKCCQQRALVDEWVFAAELGKHIASGAVPVPATIELIGFELPLTPLQQEILNACRSAGTQVHEIAKRPRREPPAELLQFETSDDELFGAAQWARTLLTAHPDYAIAIVVPDLASRISAVDRVFRQVLDPPAFTLRAPTPQPWHISLGMPLADWPLVTSALKLLALQPLRLSQPEAAHLLCSPNVAGWESEQWLRNATLAWLNRHAPFDLTMSELQRALQHSGAEQLQQQVHNWEVERQSQSEPAWPSQWAARFAQELKLLGFPAGRTLRSLEFQVLQRWHQLLDEFGSLDLAYSTALRREQALARLRERANAVIFREQNTRVPIEVLGVQEALGSHFDALWLTSLDQNTWPGPIRRDPLVPAAIQTAPGSAIPAVNNTTVLEEASAKLTGLFACAAQLQGSFVSGTEEIALQPTALLRTVPIRLGQSRLRVDAAPMAVAMVDDQAPSLGAVVTRGGTGLLRAQSDCPFRAFAQQRLGAVDLTPPRPGLSAGQRGTIIHTALERFWLQLTDADELAALSEAEQNQRVRDAVRHALDDITGRFWLLLSNAGRQLEQKRAERTLNRWLALERVRGQFHVVAREVPVSLSLGELTLTGKIDRIDQLSDGSTLLIDYKTSANVSKQSWAPAQRMVDPQLPAYAIAMDVQPQALAFAQILPAEAKFNGLSQTATGIPGITELRKSSQNFRELADWPQLLDRWRTDLIALAQTFVNGAAAVDPRSAQVCRYCHLKPLCRINERASFLETDVPPDPADADH